MVILPDIKQLAFIELSAILAPVINASLIIDKLLIRTFVILLKSILFILAFVIELSAKLLTSINTFVIFEKSTLIILPFDIDKSAYLLPVIKLSGYHNRLFNKMFVILLQSTSVILPLLILLSAYLILVIELSAKLLISYTMFVSLL